MIYYLKPGDTLLTIDGSNGHTVYQDYALTKEIPLGIYTDNVNIFQLSKGNNYNIWNVIELPLNLTPTPTPIPLSDELTILNQFPTGISNDSSYQLDPFTQAYPPTGETWTNFKLDYNDTTGRVTVTPDYRGWAVDANDVRYKVEISDKWLTEAELEAIDFSNQKGNDVLIYAAKFESGVPPRVGTTYLHIKGDSNTRLPGFVVRNPTKRMPQFIYNFPDIVVSPSKTNILEFQQLNTEFNTVSSNYTNKGFSIAHGPANNQKFIGDYDQWAYENGAPGPHNQAGALQWLRDTSIQKLNNYFQGLIGGAAGVGFFFMDFEAFGYGAVDDQDIVNKLGTLFRRFNQVNPDTIFTSYINANPVTSTFSKNISSAEKDLQNAKYTKTLDQIATGFFSRTVHYLDVNTGKFTGESGNMGQYIAPIVGNYMNSIGFSSLYSTIQEFELAKKLLPANKVLSLNWGLNETLPRGSGSDYDIFEKTFKKNNGVFYKKQAKPPTPPSYMWNITLWSNIIGDGTWFWDEPLPFIEGYEYRGSSAQDLDGNTLPNEFSPGLGSMHYYAQIGYDYIARALHFLSYNNDILEANTPIESPEFSTNNGSTYYSGNNLLPASAEFSKLPLVRIKKHATLNEWIIIAVNHHLDHYINQTIKVKIGNKTIDIILKGQYTTAERISLSSLLPTPTLPDPTPTPTFNPTSTPTKCNGVISWNNPTKTCKGNITTIGVSVNGNNNQNVEFSINGGEYQASNVGINGYTYNTPSTGDLIHFDARIVGCTSSINGSVQSCDTTLPPKPPTTPTPPPTNDSTIYKSLFTFNQKSNGQPIPTSGDYTNNYLKFHAFSHGISRNITIPQDTGVICKFEYEILNNDNEVVFSCKDNYGGFHPNFQNNPSAESYYRVWTQGHSDYNNFQWIRDYFNNFTAIPGTSFNSALDRGNNHFDIYNGYVPLNKSYVMKIKNTGNFSFQLRAGTIDTFENPNLADIYTTILPDNTWYNFNLNGIRVNNNNSGTRAYKINCYNN